MIIATTADELRAVVARARAAGSPVRFVPTMGALHAGHASLIAAARAEGGHIVVSIFVNPTQFAPGEDYQRYPRPIDADRAACREARVDLLFEPAHDQLYPPGPPVQIDPGPLAERLCGPFRPGHFRGVCTVVAKLFNIVQPDAAYFGQKDAQQAVIIRRMVEDLRMPVRIKVQPTIRDPDGLALSSRNVYLAPDERARALCLYRALCSARDLLLAGETCCGRIIARMRSVVVESGEVRVDYLSIVDPDTLEDLPQPGPRVLVAGAVRIGRTRLIDNLIVELPSSPA